MIPRIAQKSCSGYPKLRQLRLFPEIICCAYLVADSPRNAFYRIWIESDADNCNVLKESGIKGTVLDKRAWPQEDLEAARKLFDRKIRSKTNPERKCPRKYTMVYNI